LFPTSMSSSVGEPKLRSLSTLHEDCVQRLNVFISSINPADFRKLLGQRIAGLLQSWPPVATIAINGDSDTSPPIAQSKIPSVESVQAFVTFFRSQNVSEDNSTDNPELDSLHRHLVAVQSLLDFLSPTEIVNIVRSRLGDDVTEKTNLVWGVMDVLGDEALATATATLQPALGRRTGTLCTRKKTILFIDIFDIFLFLVDASPAVPLSRENTSVATNTKSLARASPLPQIEAPPRKRRRLNKESHTSPAGGLPMSVRWHSQVSSNFLTFRLQYLTYFYVFHLLVSREYRRPIPHIHHSCDTSSTH